MTLKTTLKKNYEKITSKESKENYKKALSQTGQVLKKIGASVGKARESYLEDDKKRGGGLGLLR
jgi:hypothetical protein